MTTQVDIKPGVDASPLSAAFHADKGVVAICLDHGARLLLGTDLTRGQQCQYLDQLRTECEVLLGRLRTIQETEDRKARWLAGTALDHEPEPVRETPGAMEQSPARSTADVGVPTPGIALARAMAASAIARRTQ